MASQSAVVVLVSVAFLSPCHGQGFLSGPVKGPEVSLGSLQAELNGVLHEVLGQGHGVHPARLAKIRATLQPMFRALPHNNKGHLSGPVMRFAVRRYFSQRNAWIVKGFEPHAHLVNTSAEKCDDATNTSATSTSGNILQGKVPEYIRTVLEERFDYGGFAFEDVVAVVAAVERLAFDEVVNSLETTYWLDDGSVKDALSPAEMMDVLSTFLITNLPSGSKNKTEHRFIKKHINLVYPHWQTTLLFLNDIAGSDNFQRRSYANPFVQKKTFSFDDLVRMAQRVTEEFGPWSDHECHEMKEALVQRDVHGSGRIKLADFYRKSRDGTWQFTEPSEYLRQLGALDESSPSLGPQVLIPNYITAMSNCIVSAPYYAICCPNECDQIYQHLEAGIPASTASSGEIIQVVKSLPYSSNITAALRARLDEVAETHNGNVPLHGRLMAQWLHFAFPHECPYPHEAGTITPKTPAQWRMEIGEEAESVSEREVNQTIEMDKGAHPMSVDEALNISWTRKESLLVASTPSDQIDHLFLILAQLCILLCGGAVLLSVFRRVTQRKTKFMEVDV